MYSHKQIRLIPEIHYTQRATCDRCLRTSNTQHTVRRNVPFVVLLFSLCGHCALMAMTREVTSITHTPHTKLTIEGAHSLSTLPLHSTPKISVITLRKIRRAVLVVPMAEIRKAIRSSREI